MNLKKKKQDHSPLAHSALRRNITSDSPRHASNLFRILNNSMTVKC